MGEVCRTGDLGYSFSNNSPVGPLIWVRARKHSPAHANCYFADLGLALPLGVWSAERSDVLPDTLISWAMAGLLVVPDLAVALGLLFFAVRSGWFPTAA